MRTTIALTLGLMLVVVAGPSRDDFISPGPLSSPHAFLEDCAACHSAAEHGTAAWLQAALSPAPSPGDSDRCLGCHSRQLRDFALSAHNVDPHTLAQMSESAIDRQSGGAEPFRLALAAQLGLDHERGSEVLACARCHKEHRGRAFKLTEMSNLQCQACHRQQFASFANGHPDFSPAYPTRRSTRIIFNHGTHYNGHFDNEDWEGDCLSCHQPDQAEARMLTGDFDTACGSCHRAGIRQKGSVAVFALPGLELDTLDDNGIEIGEWPEDALDVEVPLSPFMKLLLSADPAVADDLEVIGDLEKLLVLYDEDEEVVKAAGELAWAIKGLIYELLEGDEEALADRLREAFGQDLSPTEIEALTGIPPADAPLASHQSWSENLALLQQHFLEDLAEELKRAPLEIEPGISPTDSARWFFDAEEVAVRYRLVGHADPFLRAWLDRAAAGPRTSDEAAPTVVFEELFEELSGKDLQNLERAPRSAPGRCIKCHSVDSIANGDIHRYQVNWTAFRPTRDERPFTKFVHRPHLMLHDCTDCHSMFDDSADVQIWSESHAGIDFQPSFDPITKSDCAACHTAGGSGDSCIVCHRYHVSMTSLTPGQMRSCGRLEGTPVASSP